MPDTDTQPPLSHTVVDVPLNGLDTAEHRDRCLECVTERIRKYQGVSNADVRFDNGSIILECDYDPQRIEIKQLRQDLRGAVACMAPDLAYVVLEIDGLVSPNQEHAIETSLNRLLGVSATASYSERAVKVEFDRRTCVLPDIAMRLDRMGFKVTRGRAIDSRGDVVPEVTVEGAPAGDDRHAADRQRTQRDTGGMRQAQPSILRQFLSDIGAVTVAIGGLMLLVAFILGLYEAAPLVRAILLVGAYVLCGWETALDTVKTLARFEFDIDVLMFAAAFGALYLGHPEEGALLLFLFGMGHAGEELAMDRARRAIDALTDLAPDTATIRTREGRERQVRIEDVEVGDYVIVRAFDRIPIDGDVVEGRSSVDQSALTGESVPVDKTVGSQVLAGTINGDGAMVIIATKTSSESTLAKVIDLVREAQAGKSPTQLFTDRIEKWYVPAVLAATLALIVIPPLTGLGEWSTWLYRSMAFLTAASPCALAIGTPAAVLCGIARSARAGVLVKGGMHLENLGRVTVVAFDKTGTLTRGRPHVTEVVSFNGIEDDELLRIAAAVEAGSNHPLAHAIVAEAQARHLADTDATDVEQVAGVGVQGTVEGRTVLAGRIDGESSGTDDAMRDRLEDMRQRFAREGKSTVLIRIDGEPAGVIALADQLRDNAARVVRSLKYLGIQRTAMLTGDHEQAARRVAEEVGVDETHAQLLPADKLDRLRALQEKYGRIAMVGDGVNDAPALAQADVGIAMGGAGTDVALESADIALMADDLGKLPEAIGISRFSRRIIVQNLVIALGVIILLAPTAALGGATLGWAVLFHEGSTIVVVLNGLRTLFYKSE